MYKRQPYHSATTEYNWQLPYTNRFKHRTFKGYHRKDGSVGTRNYWIILPLVFCEKRNVEVIQEALVKNLGYPTSAEHTVDTKQLIRKYQSGANADEDVYKRQGIFHRPLFKNYKSR